MPRDRDRSGVTLRSVVSTRAQRLTLAALGLLSVAVTVSLLSDLDLSTRSTVSGLALMTAGALGAIGGVIAMRHTQGLTRLGWGLLAAAGVLASVGNTITGDGLGPQGGPGALSSDVVIAVALVMAITAVTCLPRNRWRGRERLSVALDGLLVLAATLVIASSLVYSDLLDETPDTLVDRASVLVIPVLDVVLGVTAVVLFLRSRGADRFVMALIAAGAAAYALADLRYLQLGAEDAFVFGTWTDLGWILGYVAFAAASVLAWHGPDADPAEATVPRARGTGVGGTVVVFGILLLAGAVQILVPVRDDVRSAQALIWLTLILTAATRQALLGRENQALRRGLERRVAEQTRDLRRMVQQTSALIESVGDGIYGVDEHGRVTFMNRSGHALLGLDEPAGTVDSVTGRVAHDAFHAPQADGSPYPHAGCYVTRAIEVGELVVGEDDEYVRADGSLLPVEITASPITDDAGSSGAVVVFRDATQRRELDRIKDEFLSVVSHELRTPLTSIRSSLGLLSGGALGELPPRAARIATLAEDSSERLARMINDMLDLERLTTGTVDLQITSTSAAELVDAVVSELTGLASVAGVRLEVASSEGRVMVDGDRFVQVMTNLVGNAVKFSSPGQTVTITARGQGDTLLVGVTDEGRGIPPEQIERVFERFHQVDSSDSRAKGGTGLGLTISRELIERMNGRIWAESVVGSGTTFWFTLPLAALEPLE